MNPIGVVASKSITAGSLVQAVDWPGATVMTTSGFTHCHSQCRYDADRSNCRPPTGIANISPSTPQTCALPAFCGNAQGPGPPNCGHESSTICASLKSL